METLPEGLPPLPEGTVYLGKGGEFNTKGVFPGLAYLPGVHDRWRSGDEWMGIWSSHHYAAPADSEIARLNQSSPSDESPALDYLREFVIAAQRAQSGDEDATKALPYLAKRAVDKA